MPVAVIGATSVVGRALVPLLTARGGEVRVSAPDRAAAERFRALGAKAAVGEPEEALWPLLQDAHTVCLVGTDPLAPDDATERMNREVVEATVSAAVRAGLRRVLFLSSVGASPGSDNATLRALGAAEDLVRGSGLEHVVLRVTHPVGPGATWLAVTRALVMRRPPVVVGPGTQALAPVHAEDVARILAAADDRADPVGELLAAEGPDRLSADQAADLLAGRPRRWKRHPVRPPGIGAAAAEILAGDCLADAPSGHVRFGVVPTSVLPLLRGADAGEG